jgi:DNA-binding transcriptional LysR family regulator
VHRDYPKVQVKLVEALGWPDTRAMLERGEVHLGQNLLHAVDAADQRFGRHPLEAIDLLAAGQPTLTLGNGGTIEIGRLSAHPLLLLDGSFVFRRTFDAACRLAGFQPNITFESRAPHTLLAMASRGHGVAIIPSALQTARYALRIVGITYRGKPLREPLAVFWDKRRPLPRYATAFCEMLAGHMREVFPITRPSAPKPGARARRTASRRP